MAAKKKQAKFFCEFCDSEVPAKARFCPKCGHFFLSVRCPACGKTGSHEEFEHGCPQCGYAFDGENNNATNNSNNNSFAHDSEHNRTDIKCFTASRRKRKNDDALPLWIYAATFIVFAGILMFIISQCRT